jgi:ornithine carbamoyltransferase
MGSSSSGSRTHDFLRLCDRSGEQLEGVLRLAAAARADTTALHGSLPSSRIALIWDAPGFRTRVAFDLAVRDLGAQGVEVPIAFSGSEPLEDIAGYLSNWFDLIVVRTRHFHDLQRFASAARIPVVNALTEHNHPCEVLSDIASLASTRDLRDLQVVFVGAATNLAHSWFEAATVLPISVTQVSPPGFEVDLEWWHGLSAEPIGEVAVTHDLSASLRTADVIYTDAWPERSARGSSTELAHVFGGLQITTDLLDRSGPNTIFLPCPPVTRGQEVSAGAMAHPKCRVYEAKQWLLYGQESLLYETLSATPFPPS